MNVTGISCTCSAATPAVNDGFNQLFKDFKGIGTALASGDLSAAATALSTFQSDLQNNPGRNPLSRLFKHSDKLAGDLKALQEAVGSNDTAKSQEAFKTLIKDMQEAMKSQRSHRHHHRHHVERDEQSENFATTTATAGSTGEVKDGADGSLDVQA